MHLTHLIIDDFFPDPGLVRRAALQLAYEPPSSDHYFPGRNAVLPLALTGLDDVISGIAGEELMPVPGTSHLKARIALAGDESVGGVHVDECHWSGIIYLTLDEHCQGGTSFHRHKRTGTERAPVFPEDLQKMGYATPGEVWADVIDPDTKRPEAWDTLFTVPMKFNRLVLFRSYLWHNAGDSFGSTLEDGRLILPLFYQPRATR